MPKAIDSGLVQPYKGDPFVGHLSTPISDSNLTKAFINNLPIYRQGISPILRGLEVGMAHGYFIFGPMAKLGPLRDATVANIGGLMSTIALVLIATICLSFYGIVSFPGNKAESEDSLKTPEGWSQFTGGFFIGGMGGAVMAFFLIENFGIVDSILQG